MAIKTELINNYGVNGMLTIIRTLPAPSSLLIMRPAQSTFWGVMYPNPALPFRSN
jgi:hypothetical protein